MRIDLYAEALDHYAPHFDAMGVDRDALMFDLLYRLDGKGDGKPCGSGWISKRKKCSKKSLAKLTAALKAGDKGAISRVMSGKKKAADRQALKRAVEQDKGKKARDVSANTTSKGGALTASKAQKKNTSESQSKASDKFLSANPSDGAARNWIKAKLTETVDPSRARDYVKEDFFSTDSANFKGDGNRRSYRDLSPEENFSRRFKARVKHRESLGGRYEPKHTGLMSVSESQVAKARKTTENAMARVASGKTTQANADKAKAKFEKLQVTYQSDLAQSKKISDKWNKDLDGGEAANIAAGMKSFNEKTGKKREELKTLQAGLAKGSKRAKAKATDLLLKELQEAKDNERVGFDYSSAKGAKKEDILIKAAKASMKQAFTEGNQGAAFLGISGEVTKEKLKAAYRRKASETHPDKKGGSREKFEATQSAYEALKKKYRFDAAACGRGWKGTKGSCVRKKASELDAGKASLKNLSKGGAVDKGRTARRARIAQLRAKKAGKTAMVETDASIGKLKARAAKLKKTTSKAKKTAPVEAKPATNRRKLTSVAQATLNSSRVTKGKKRTEITSDFLLNAYKKGKFEGEKSEQLSRMLGAAKAAGVSKEVEKVAFPKAKEKRSSKAKEKRPEGKPKGSATIKDQAQFNKEAGEKFQKLAKDYDGLVPIARLRKELSAGDSFDGFIKEMQQEGYTLIGGEAPSTEEFSTKELFEGGVKSLMGGQRFYIKKDALGINPVRHSIAIPRRLYRLK